MSIRAIDLAGNRSDAATRCTTVGSQLGDTARAAHAHAWPARHHRPSHGPGGWHLLAVLAALATCIGGRLAMSSVLAAAQGPPR